MASPDVAFLAMFHRFASERNSAAEAVRDGRTFRLCHVRGTLLREFPNRKKRKHIKSLDIFDERFYFYGARSRSLTEGLECGTAGGAGVRLFCRSC